MSMILPVPPLSAPIPPTPAVAAPTPGDPAQPVATPAVPRPPTVGTHVPVAGLGRLSLHATIARVIPGWEGDLEDLLTVLAGIVAGLSAKGILPGGDALTIAGGVIAVAAQAVQQLGAIFG